MASQLALLALNFREMPARYLRLFACASVLAAEVLLFYLNSKPGVSYMSHLGGAATGLCISLVFSCNVRLRRRDVVLVWVGFGGYLSLVGIALAFQQLAAGCLSAACIPFLALRASITAHRAFVRRLTQSQLDANSVGRRPHRRSTGVCLQSIHTELDYAHLLLSHTSTNLATIQPVPCSLFRGRASH